MMKNKKLMLIVLVILLTTPSFNRIRNLEATEPAIAQNGTEGGGMKLKKFQEQVFFSTVRITLPNKTGVGASIGTGFLVQIPLHDKKNRSIILLISNRHVFADPANPIILNFNKRKADGLGPDLGHPVILRGDEFKGIYQSHPDPSVDLACINVSGSITDQNNLFVIPIGDEMLSDLTEDDLLPGVDVWFVGYPENRFDTTNNLPLLRRGYISSIPKVDFNSKKQFIIDAQVYPGSSGSPVFAALGDKFKLIGIVAETMIRNERLQVAPANMGLGVHQVIGLGIVIKSSLVKELIDYAIEQIKLNLEKREAEPTMRNFGDTILNSPERK